MYPSLPFSPETECRTPRTVESTLYAIRYFCQVRLALTTCNPETRKGRPEAALCAWSCSDAYGVTVSVVTTCVMPGVRFDVIEATEWNVPSFFEVMS